MTFLRDRDVIVDQNEKFSVEIQIELIKNTEITEIRKIVLFCKVIATL